VSRRIVRSDDKFEVVVGWDPPLRTFFVQVYDVAAFAEAIAADPDANYVMPLWKGFDPGEVPTPEDAARLVEPWVTLSEQQLVTLRNDKEANRA
jgi:hypothetical protein